MCPLSDSQRLSYCRVWYYFFFRLQFKYTQLSYTEPRRLCELCIRWSKTFRLNELSVAAVCCFRSTDFDSNFEKPSGGRNWKPHFSFAHFNSNQSDRKFSLKAILWISIDMLQKSSEQGKRTWNRLFIHGINCSPFYFIRIIFWRNVSSFEKPDSLIIYPYSLFDRT